jgi:DNA-binding response OmpR family regulator
MSISVATKFLVVDHSEAVRQVLIQKLRAYGAQRCLEASNGEEALAILKQQSVDLILSDNDTEPMSGLDLLKTIRTDAKLCSVSFIMITNESSRDYLLDMIKYGVSSVLVKPYTFDGLGEHIEKALKNPLKTAVPLVKKTDILEGNSKSFTPATILVVDDEPNCLEILAEIFKDEYRVLVAQNGAKALEICTSDTQPDLVLLDVMMPNMDGFEVTRRLREHPNSQHIPVIFITALASKDARIKGLDLGAVDVVTKPIDPDILKMRVRNFMRYVELHKQLQSDHDAMLENVRLRDVIGSITRHDLKVPLTGIVHLIETMLENGEFNTKQLEQLKMMKEIALQATQTVNFSTELYKIETGHFELKPQPVKINVILHRLVEIARETFREKNLKISISIDVSLDKTMPRVLGDATLCYSLFHNLINNACEYTNEKSEVTVLVSNTDPIKITIKNQGVVPLKLREPFFEKYLDSISTKWGGAYATKLMAEAQHGSISLDVSDVDDLTTLTVYLPKFVGSFAV